MTEFEKNVAIDNIPEDKIFLVDTDDPEAMAEIKRLATVEQIVEQTKKDYKLGLLVGINTMIERHGFDKEKTRDAMMIFVDREIAERDKKIEE